MNEQTRALKALCEDLRERYADPGEPADPAVLAARLGVRVRYFPLGETKGFYVVLDGVPFIAIDEAQPPQVQRIVCAHELGHHLLHRDLAEQVLFNEYELYRMETKVEREANLFACFLLIPDDPSAFFRRPENRDVSVEEAARLFGTTRELLSIRLQAEGYGPAFRVSRFPS